MSDARVIFRPVGFATVLATLVLIQYSGVLTGTETFFHRDFHLFGYPLAAWFRQSLLAGDLPLWNPLNYCGIPFLAQWNTMVLYPPNWLNLLLPLSWSLALFCILHLYAGGLGMYFLAANWTRNLHGAAFAGIAYAFNGLTQNCLMWPNNIAALGCLPWVLLTASLAWRNGGGAIVIGSLVATLQMLSGAPEIILLTWLFLAGLAGLDVIKHPAKRAKIAVRFVALVLIVTGISAAQLLPFLDLLRFSERAAAGAPVEWSILPGGWANFFVPLAGITEQHPTGIYYHTGQHWTHSYYAGLLPWLLLVPALSGVGGTRKWLAIACVPCAFLLALGPDVHVYRWLNALLPLDAMRYPVKFIVLTTVALPIVGAFGLRRMLANRPNGTLIPAILLVGGALVVIAQGTAHNEAPDFITANLRGRMFVLATAATIIWLCRRPCPVPRTWLIFLLLLTAWLDLKTSQVRLAPTVPREQLEKSPPMWEQFADAQPGAGRIAATAKALYASLHLANTNVVAANNFTLFENVNLTAGLSKVDGFYSLWLPWLTESQQRLHANPNTLAPGLADFLGVVWTLTVDPVSGRSFRWLPGAKRMPLITAGQAPRIVSGEAALDALQEFDPRTTVLLAETPGIPLERVPSASVNEMAFRPHRITFTVKSPKPTVAVIAQADFHWWRATIDGEPAHILRANHGYQALVVPAGERRVEMTYVDRSFRLGVTISLLTLAGLFCWAWRLRPLKRADVSLPPRADSSD